MLGYHDRLHARHTSRLKSLRRLTGREHPARVAIVAGELRRRRQPRYLEVGVNTGVVFLHVRARSKTGVDPAPVVPLFKRLVYPNTLLRGRLIRATSDEFFASLGPDERFDVVFVDGDHSFARSMRDIEHAVDHLAEGGVVLVHDCDPPTAQAAASDPQAARGGAWCGEVWRSVVMLRATRADLTIDVIDADFGIGVVRRRPSPTLGIEPGWVARMTYADLVADRGRLLGVRDEAAAG